MIARSAKTTLADEQKLEAVMTTLFQSGRWLRFYCAILLCSGFAAGASVQSISLSDSALGSPAGGAGDSALPVFSSDTRYVLFASTANNLVKTASGNALPTRLTRQFNVFLRDRTNGTDLLVSVNLAGTGGGNGDSLPIAISTNGQYALFESTAEDLTALDANNMHDVYVRDLTGGFTTLVSVSTNGTSGNGESRESSMTPDGRYVVFVSAATDLVAADTNGIPDVFVRDLQTGMTTLVSIGAKSIGTSTSSSSAFPKVAANGRFVTFFSTATNLISGLRLPGEVYVRDLVTETTTWASTNARSLFQSVVGSTNAISFRPSISVDGQFVAFGVCINSVTTWNPQGLILRYSLQTGVTDLVHTNASVPYPVLFNEIETMDMTADGRFIAFVANAGSSSGNTAIYLWDAQTATSTLVSADQDTGLPVIGMCEDPRVSTNGQYVAFLCDGTNLTADTLLGKTHLYRHDVSTGNTRLVDVDTNGFGSGMEGFADIDMSADGNLIAFGASDGNLVSNDNNHQVDVFARDLTSNAIELISAYHPTLPSLTPNGFNSLFSSSVSTNGRHIAFTSEADNLLANDTNRLRDVFVRDLQLGTNLLVSVGINGFAGNGRSSEPAISGGGNWVAFSSHATNLVAGDTNKSQDIFLRDVQAGTTTLVNISTNGGFGDADAYLPVISTDARYVLFRSQSRNLANGSFGTGIENLFLRDRQFETTYALTTGSSGAGISSAAMTPDGRFVAFVGRVGTGGTNLYVWDSQSASRNYTNSVTSPATVSISPDGQRVALLGGNPLSLSIVDLASSSIRVVSAGTFLSRPGLRFSANGRFLAYATSAAKVPNDTNAAQDVYLYDFETGTNLLVSRSFDSAGAPNGSSDTPEISADGHYVAYRSAASNIVESDLNTVPDVFLYDVAHGGTTLVSVNRFGSSTADNRSLTPLFSGDGKSLVFQTWASDLPGQDFNQFCDLFQLNLAAPAITDSDDDNLDDAWEMVNFQTLARDGLSDFDGDGVSDVFEFLTGSNPADPASAFQVEVVYTGSDGPNPALAWPLALGKAYRVQFKNELTDPAWQDLNSNVTLVGNLGHATDLVPASAQRFYRVLLEN
jgi:Tol biopolymer transport system component